MKNTTAIYLGYDGNGPLGHSLEKCPLSPQLLQRIWLLKEKSRLKEPDEDGAAPAAAGGGWAQFWAEA